MKLFRQGKEFSRKLFLIGNFTFCTFWEVWPKHFPKSSFGGVMVMYLTIKKGSWWSAEIFWNKGFEHSVSFSFVSRATKLIWKKPLWQSEYAKLKNSAKNSPNFHAKINSSGNVTFSVYKINKIWTKISSKIY